MSEKCEGYRRYGGAFTMGPVQWVPCTETATVIIRVRQKNKDIDELPACLTCWGEAMENDGMEVLSARPISSSNEDPGDKHGLKEVPFLRSEGVGGDLYLRVYRLTPEPGIMVVDESLNSISKYTMEQLEETFDIFPALKTAVEKMIEDEKQSRREAEASKE